ncbi:SWIM zinc finger family protein [Streptomyces sp. A7024]|uniref:SWIM zinc finger family protein n=1 Tax=Streptomyces coryli TaxID=1128680 RepID=A0A6G4UER7_9ACTN|nr:SWIM zinc finger family protein [Streptomyces coryli]NGN69961.1 SWIM zinc finger family protein [Streptomyces coryli]
MTRTAVTLAYRTPSALEPSAGGSLLGLQTAGGSSPRGAMAHPSFFAGFIASPRVYAAGLLSVADVAAARYYRPERRASLDPVVTGNGDRLRFESFSGCCGVHARLDVLAEGLEGRTTERGTTNVDVNNPLREALTRLAPDEPLHLRVGPDELAVTTAAEGPLVEKKVPLPDRWVRGFAETQVLAAGFDLRAELDAAQAVRFLRSLPAGGTAKAGAPAGWRIPAPGGVLRPTSRAVPGAVCLAGPERLGALRRVLRHITGLRVYGPPVRAGSEPVASAWEVGLPGMRLTLTLSPGVSRGFSGEGAVLQSLASDTAAEDAELLSVLLAWEARVEIAELGAQAGLDTARVRDALTRLGTAGRIGYDVAEAAYYHRELPYDADRAEAHNPRLRDARALVGAGAVELDGDTGVVRSGEQVYRVHERDGVLGCTCPWWAKYRGGRGPCKHALAVRLVRRGELVAMAGGVA